MEAAPISSAQQRPTTWWAGKRNPRHELTAHGQASKLAASQSVVTGNRRDPRGSWGPTPSPEPSLHRRRIEGHHQGEPCFIDGQIHRSPFPLVVGARSTTSLDPCHDALPPE
uniref:Uncharacterized protein n=1 Tax=Oryza sativa subsp. japonica TaxID=39947 RepID=Q8LIF4_ORYSJ|nr:hypothetical protein [Oryza sativa Japonica Group]BAD31452.1 hypothetical protein [Oryza sativa Japonica Group]